MRADSAAYQATIVNWCEASGKQFAIGADQDTAVKAAIAAIPEDAWKKFRDGEIAETVHCMNKTKKAFRRPEGLALRAIRNIIHLMEWPVEYTDEFGNWWDGLTEAEQISIDAHVRKLEQRGPNLPFPYSSGIERSRHAHMRELCVQSGGKPLRVFYAFDPRRMAILLIGGDKTGDRRFYERMIPIADALYDEHLAELEKEQNDGR